MRYELDVNGYVLAVFWGCNSGNCAEYTGEVPYGYTDLIDWSENALINAYYIDNSGNLVLDSDRKAKLEEKVIIEEIDNTLLFAKDLYGSNAVLDSQYQKQFATGTILKLENVKNISPKVKITNIDYIENTSISLYSHSRNMLKNDGKTETINGVNFTSLPDGSIKINGTATANIEYNLSGSSTNTIPIFVLKNNKNYYLNIGGYSCEMKYHDGETTAQVYTGASGVINLSEDKEVTQVLLKIPKGTTINNKIIFPMLNYGTKAEPYEEYKCKVLNIDFGEPFSSDALYPDDELYPSDDLFPSGEEYVTDYILIENGAIYVSRDNVVRILKAGNVQVFDGNTTLYVDNDATIEILYSIDALNVEKDFDTKLTKTKEEIKLEAFGTYTTKTETAEAKQEAIDSANASTDDKLKEYSTTTEMNAAISVKADSIINSVDEKISSEIGKDNITNGTFENDLDNWASDGSVTVQENNGTNYAQIISKGALTKLSQTIKGLKKDTEYTLIFNAYDNGDLEIDLEDGLFQADIIQYKEGSEETFEESSTRIYVTKQNKTYEVKFTPNENIDLELIFSLKNPFVSSYSMSVMLSNIALINGEVTEKLSKLEMKSDLINLEVRKKVGNDEIISRINQTAESITIDANKLNINGTVSANGNFKVSTEGDVTINGGNINLQDNGYYTNGQIVSTQIDNPDREAVLYSGGLWVRSDYNGNIGGAFDSYQMYISNGSTVEDTPLYGVIATLGNENKNPYLDVFDNVSNVKTSITPFSIKTPTLTQTSLAEQKKNLEKLDDNAIDIIKNIDIYKYNLKSENDTDKKHIGFVIGEDYNYSEEVTSLDNKGVDNYSFTSLCCKAIQEQQKIIEDLQKQVKELKEVKQ